MCAASSCGMSLWYSTEMAKLLDGRKVRDDILEGLSRQIAGLSEKPCLSIIQVGSREESNTYIGQKIKFGTEIGIDVRHIHFAEDVSQKEVVLRISELNGDSRIHGILLQLPLPPHLNKEILIESIHPQKDVDGLTSSNMKHLLSGEEGIIPATAKGVLLLLRHYGIALSGKKALVIGASVLVGKPIALTLLNNDATVTIANSKSGDIAELSKASDIVIVAAGSPKLVTKEYVCAGQTIIDVGISSVIQDGKRTLVGDVDFEEVSKIVDAITPVPGGVGPMTIACLFENLFEAYRLQKKL
jgi:methylenetetrahydrofolate dehydrogenase (NADP+)/methenyltetrahydrofolate cyclohydrolase